MKIHWTGVAAAAVSILGVVGSPAVTGILPPSWAAVVSGLGIIAQGLTHKAVAPSPPA